MTHTILFRGKDKNTGEWVSGDLVTAFPDCPNAGKVPHKYIVKIKAHGGCLYVSDRHWVNPDTIGQFTGLYDANHKMIFEGDLVAATRSVVEEIVYDCTLSRFVTAIGGDKDKLGCNPTQSWIDQIHIIVVGNKWDDPELLK